ncbi:replication initiation protein RepC, partial [Rhizobium sp. YJ-22]|nr:replication initiation protein RepC [Rhizobium sp. YJ-22]
QAVAAERAQFRKAKEDLTICRRDVRKLITAALEEGADGDWQAVEQVYVGLVGCIPRAPSLTQLASLLDEMTLLREEILNRLETRENSRI